MSISFFSIILPVNTTDIKVDDIDNDGVAEIVVVAKNNSDDVPAGSSLYVYEEKTSGWERVQKIKLGKKAVFWEVENGIWGIDGDGIQNLYTQTTVLQSRTWLSGLGKASPKQADFVNDLNWDREPEFVLNSDGKISVHSESGRDWGTIPIPKIGSIREYSKTGGAALEIAQRSAPVVVEDVNGDGIKDLIFLMSTTAEIHFSADGVLGVEKKVIELPINVEPQYTTRSKRELSSIEFVDLNGDQKMDMVWRYWLTGETRFGAKSEVGWALGNGAGFETSQSFIQEQAIVNTQVEDLDSDGDRDLLLFGTDLGLGSLAAALVSQSASVNLQVSNFENERFQSQPMTIHTFSLPIKTPDVLDCRSGIDINQDGQTDFMVVLSDKYLEYHRKGSTLKEVRNEKLEMTGGKIYLGCSECSRPTAVIWKKGTVQAQIFHVK